MSDPKTHPTTTPPGTPYASHVLHRTAAAIRSGDPKRLRLPPWLLDAARDYLTLTDRLCALVGLGLAPGEVARWERTDDHGTWELAGGGLRCRFEPEREEDVLYAVPALADATDPLTALHLALSALSDG